MLHDRFVNVKKLEDRVYESIKKIMRSRDIAFIAVISILVMVDVLVLMSTVVLIIVICLATLPVSILWVTLGVMLLLVIAPLISWCCVEPPDQNQKVASSVHSVFDTIQESAETLLNKNEEPVKVDVNTEIIEDVEHLDVNNASMNTF